MTRKQVLVFVWSIAFALLSSCAVLASSGQEDVNPFKISGFATVGLVNGGDEILGFQRDWSHGKSRVFDGDWSLKQDTLFGVQVDATFTREFNAAIQLVARDRLENSLENSIELAFLRYRIFPNLTVRGGRMGTDVFMLSEYRNIGFAYLWVRPPMEFYGMISLDSLDGVDMSYTTDMGDGFLRVGAFYGISNNYLRGRVGQSPLDMEPIFGGSLLWESDSWQARLGAAFCEFGSSIESMWPVENLLRFAAFNGWPEAYNMAEDMESEGDKINYYSAGLAYNENPWSLQTEISFIDSDFDYFPPSVSAYLSVAHRFGPVQLYGVAAFAESTEDRELLAAAPQQWALLQQSLQSYKDYTRIDQKSVSFGLRWDIRNDLALKVQWDHHWVNAHGGFLWFQNERFDEDRTLDTFSVNLNFIF